MKNIFFLFICAIILCAILSQNAQAKVYLIGRNIEISTDSSGKKHMLTRWGHSFLLVLPDNPAELARELKKQGVNYAAELEKTLAPGIKGFVIGGYPGNGSQRLKHLDGDLVAVINEPGEEEPVRDWLTHKNYDLWNFVGGEVTHEGQTDTQFILALLQHTWAYQLQSKKADYNAFHSAFEHAFSPEEQRAQNCNALAFSLLAYSNATDAPDIGAERSMPGNHCLLPRGLFKNSEILDPNNLPVPPLVLNHKSYEQRKEAIRQLKQAFLKAMARSIPAY